MTLGWIRALRPEDSRRIRAFRVSIDGLTWEPSEIGRSLDRVFHAVDDLALQHHERLDGSGYPQGLKGDAILLETRIVSVADVVEVMSSHRPYRPGLGIEKALAEIEQGRGTPYDTVVAEACLRLFRDKGYAIPK